MNHWTKVHPRTCGEKHLDCRSICHDKGSPPHMRGKVRYQLAGACPARVHPRTCGEKGLCSMCSRRTRGSPPHMRGKGDQSFVFPMDLGFTPAHAGKSAQLQPVLFWKEVHPRTCGEKLPWCARRPGPLGSPPHMRGKVIGDKEACAISRFTPAHAGKRRFLFPGFSRY